MASFAGIQSIIQSAAVNKPTVESTTATAETNSVDTFTEVANVADFAPVSESTQESEDANTSEADTENFINSSLAVSSFGGIDMPKKYSFLYLSIIYFLLHSIEEEIQPSAESITRPSTKPKKKDDAEED